LSERAEKFGFILIEDFALMSAASSVDPLRAANQMSGRVLYETCFLSVAGGPVRSSCGGLFETIPFSQAPPDLDWLFIVAGGNPFTTERPDCLTFLRQAARRGISLGGISAGVVLLAKAGLLYERRIAVHWEYVHALRELLPELLTEQHLFVLDRDRVTCAGGVAGLDMMHALIRSRHGHELAAKVSGRFIYTRIRTPEVAQRGIGMEQSSHRTGVFAALRLMEDHIADPLPLKHLARLAGLSSRQLQRQFQGDLGRSVMAAYTSLRLTKADELLRQTKLPISQIAFATGFSSQANFTRSFVRCFGLTPSERRIGSRIGGGDLSPRLRTH
jgi:transcriptional regulator GlxA family with amidase domain